MLMPVHANAKVLFNTNLGDYRAFGLMVKSPPPHRLQQFSLCDTQHLKVRNNTLQGVLLEEPNHRLDDGM